jgi:hypothetical protein
MTTAAYHRNKKIAWIVLLLLVVLTEIVKYFPASIEQIYAQGIYPPVAKGLRFLLGWIPFSMGDLLIGILILYVIRTVVTAIQVLRKKQWKWNAAWRTCTKWLFALLSAYILFHALWGFNYYRLGSAYLLQIEPNEYRTADVDTLLNTLHKRLQIICKDSPIIEQQKTQQRTELKAAALAAYVSAAAQYEFLHFSNSSLKPNLLGPLQSYTGYGGYLFPFTGEAQVNFYAPAFTLPFTVCHEMAHQQGFGTESEANMIGFLACRASVKKLFVYSAYADMHSYAINEMWLRDSSKAKTLYKQVPLLLQKDRKEMYAWMLRHKNPAQPVLNYIYKNYLLSTNQPQGLQSYNRVVAWLIAYGKKYGWEKI